MDFPPITSWQWLAIAVFLCLAAFLVWKFRLEEVVQYPLANEEDCGVWKVPLPGMGRPVQVGRVTTARNHFTALYSKDVTAAKGDERDKKLAMRDEVLGKYLFAQRSGRDKIIYICDANPQDPANHVREDIRGNVQVSWIPVQDCLSAGVGSDGFEYIVLKLTTKTAAFTAEEREYWLTLAEALKYEKLSANNTEQIKSKDEQIAMLKEQTQNYLATINSTMGEKAKSDLIAGTRDLINPQESPPLPHAGHMPTIKEFFTWAQVAASALAFLVIPYLMRAANLGPPAEPTTFAAVGAFFAWILTPFIRKTIGR